MKTLRVVLCQINPTVGDLDGNVQKILSFMKRAQEHEPDIIVFPELAVTGYPPEDLLLRPSFISDNLDALRTIQDATGSAVVIAGFVDRKEDIYNAAAVMQNKKLLDIYHKVYLSNYGVFDESRYFRAGTRSPMYKIENINFNISICEDIRYPEAYAASHATGSADLMININSSPYHAGKSESIQKMISTRAFDNGVFIAYLNSVGGQDELVLDGGSFIVDQNGRLAASAEQFEEDLIVADLDLESPVSARKPISRKLLPVRKNEVITVRQQCSSRTSRMEPSALVRNLVREEEIFRALVLGTKDYIRKNSFKKMCVGLSGGVDSALVLAIAVEAVGSENVVSVFMPSCFTSEESRKDSYELAANLGIRIIEQPISRLFDLYMEELAPVFNDMQFDAAEENLQARIRGNILMAMSNKFGWLVLTTSNKSEMSVGYSTLYGDMAGGFAVIRDIPKTDVYRIAEWYNRTRVSSMIPENILTKAPTAELRTGQKDTDSLPPYDKLDPLLKAYIDENRDNEYLLSCGLSEDETIRVLNMVDASEYKRRQSPPGIKITERAFGRDRRVPITNCYRKWI
ncbi:MAG: NAD+ synthase [Dissulfurispiraceae bacterium]|jgi:NAD+ synthase (glutamine-hydrolysing)|nr:NAD+ synthase [Dissulfurispiraceae bacterium]